MCLIMCNSLLGSCNLPQILEIKGLVAVAFLILALYKCDSNCIQDNFCSLQKKRERTQAVGSTAEFSGCLLYS